MIRWRARCFNSVNPLLCCLLAALVFPGIAVASEYHGQVTFGGFPVPGVTIRLTHGATVLSTISDQGGLYNFEDLTDGAWHVEIEMQCFSTINADVTVEPKTPPGKWDMQLLPLAQIMQHSTPATVPIPIPPANATGPVKKHSASGTENATAPDTPRPDTDSDAADGFLVNGSSNNAATSKFSIDQAFGNQRSSGKGLYNGGIAAFEDNSILDARPYSLSGLNTPKGSYNRITGELTFGGPIRIPHLLPHGPKFFIAYQWTRDRTAATESGLVPTAAERGGDLSSVLNATGQPVTIINAATGLPFAGNIVPVSAQAAGLLQLYPLPNISAANSGANGLYNYQTQVLNSSHQDALLVRMDKTVGRKDQVFGSFSLRSTRAASLNLFHFNDTIDSFGLNTSVNWAHRFSQHLFLNAGYRFSRLRTRVTPYFENRTNVSGAAGIVGNDQQPVNWGPPNLYFAGQISALSDGENSFNRNRTDGVSASVAIYRGRHNLTLGGDFRKQDFNDFFQQNSRGVFTFTGAATAGPTGSATASLGSDLADFLIGVPDTSSIAFGNPDKYFRQAVYDAYATDDWRILSTLTINAGMRWEYGAPMTELHGRLVNLDVAPGFGAVTPVLGSAPIGPLTGTHYSSALVRPDKLGFEPRVGVSWRPIPASTVVIRAGYGVYHDTSVYQGPALALAQQAPLSKSLNVQNSAACPLTLADGFVPCVSTTSDNFAIDPDFRVGYAQTWQLAVQRDLPGSLQLVATYLGVKGLHGVQQFLPNTYPVGALNPCPACPAGFVYQTSGGESTRQSGQLQLRRRLKNGFTASLLYTYSKSIDDDAFLGGQGHEEASTQAGAADLAGGSAVNPATTGAIAQNWLNLHAERALSNFDQRHLLKLQAQYTSGEGLGGGTLMSGWRGRLLKEWSVVTQVGAGTGLPETPVFLAAVPGTGFTGTIRPDRTGLPVYSTPKTPSTPLHLNAAAYSPPRSGQWGTAGRNSITGPGQFTLDTSFARTFRPTSRYYVDLRVDATNLLNHVNLTDWNTVVNGLQFGLPVAANPMRSLQTTLRLRF